MQSTNPSFCILLSYIVLLCTTLSLCSCASEIPIADGDLQLLVDNKNYVLKQGKLYHNNNGSLHYLKDMYDIDHITKTYFKKDDQIIARALGKEYVLPAEIIEDFEVHPDIPSLILAEHNWTSMSLLSPRAPSVADYVQLKKDIILGTGDFKDNTLHIDQRQSHSGKHALRCYAVKPQGSGKTAWITKSSLDSNLLYNEKGDRFSCSAYFYIAEGNPVTLMDIESSYINEGPGLRIILKNDLQPAIELKWAHKPTWRCATDIQLPRKKWFQLKLIATLDDQQDGHVELQLDGKTIINEKGQTLPLADAVYDRLEIGITANNNGNCVVFVDDVHYQRKAP
ncbi:MAG: hypothetical protein HRU15_14060 [Planctomycetes bacterium]|nr:hypothetical protein [Planctomycetota bacterium]